MASVYESSQRKNFQEKVRKACNDNNLGAMLSYQSTVDGGARMQVVTLLAIGHMMMKDHNVEPLTGIGHSILMQVKERVTRFGKSAYPMSEKQIAVVAREVQTTWNRWNA